MADPIICIIFSNKAKDFSQGFEVAIESIRSGAAFDKLTQFVEATSGNKSALLTITGGAR